MINRRVGFCVTTSNSVHSALAFFIPTEYIEINDDAPVFNYKKRFIQRNVLIFFLFYSH